MKILIGILAVLLAVNDILALPANSPNDDAEVISVPRRPVSSEEDGPDFRDFKGVIDTGSGYPFLQPHPLPFSFNFGFFDTFDDILRRFREQVWRPEVSDESGSTEIGSRGSFDSSKANTTSTVKVVNGHKIEVNETVYGDDDSSFHVRIVNIRPVDSGEDVEETVNTNVESGSPSTSNPVTSSPKKDTEKGEDSDERREPLERDNEIRNSYNERASFESNNKSPSTSLSPSSVSSATTTAETATTEKTSSGDNRNAILNAAFVSDNSFVRAENENEKENRENGEDEDENGNGENEAETNKAAENKMLEKYDETTDSVTLAATEDEVAVGTTTEGEHADDVETSSAAGPIDAIAEASEDVISSVNVASHDTSLTIENNEETEANDNFNESSGDAGNAANAANAVEITKDFNKLTLENASSSDFDLELNGEVVVPSTSTIETFSIEHFENDDEGDATSSNADVDVDVGVDVGIENVGETPYLSQSESLIGEREDYATSSDDEGGEAIEMNPVFNSEWESLNADLINSSDQSNDLNNEIDGYASVAVDLSNDIAVNDIAAAQADFPINPDAEFVDVSDGMAINPIGIGSMPKFEKLSLSESYQAHPESTVTMMRPAK